MKKMLFACAALLATAALSAQEPPFTLDGSDTTRHRGFELPDSLAHLSPWHPDYRSMELIRMQPEVSMTSIVVIRRENMPSRVVVLDNNTLRLGEHVNVSNGQAWNWGSGPGAYLDARTLSFPGGR